MNKTCMAIIEKSFDELQQEKENVEGNADVTNEMIITRYTTNLHAELLKMINDKTEFNPFVRGFMHGILVQFFKG